MRHTNCVHRRIGFVNDCLVPVISELMRIKIALVERERDTHFSCLRLLVYGALRWIYWSCAFLWGTSSMSSAKEKSCARRYLHCRTVSRLVAAAVRAANRPTSKMRSIFFLFLLRLLTMTGCCSNYPLFCFARLVMDSSSCLGGL